MHVEEFTRLFGIVVIVFFVGAVAWGVSQVAPQVQKVATMGAQIEADNTRIQSAAQLASAQTQEQIKALPTLTALDVQAKQAAIEAERAQASAQATATILDAQSKANAQLIDAQGKADAARAQAQGFVIIAAGAFVVAALFVSMWFALGAIQTRNTREAVQLAAQYGAVLQLPNGHTIDFQRRGVAQLGTGQTSAGALPTGAPVSEQTRAQELAQVQR